MKKIIPFVAAVLFALSAQAQTVNIHMADGNIVKYFASDVEHVNFTRAIPAPEGNEAVDLGLPSGTKWATMNVGATSVTDPGLYFAWGETTGYGSDTSDGRSFDWESYEWGNGTKDVMTKYNAADGKKVLDPEDDAATVNWGSDWRMPTFKEICELEYTQYNTTDYEWTWYDGTSKKYEGSSVAGWKVESKKSGTAGNHIFLPAGGQRRNAEIITYVDDTFSEEALNYITQGSSFGLYWSSQLHKEKYARASAMYFDSGIVSSNEDPNHIEGEPWNNFQAYSSCTVGYLIRPVKK